MGHRNPDYESLEGLTLVNNSLTSLTGLDTSWLMRKGGRLLDVRNNQLRDVSLLWCLLSPDT